MNLFDVHTLAYVMHDLSTTEGALLLQKISATLGGTPMPKPTGEVLKRAERSLGLAENFFKVYQGFPASLKATQHAKYRWEHSTLDSSCGAEIMNRLQIDILGDLEDRVFLSVVSQRKDFIDCKDGLFGKAVFDEFPSAREDIREAGNCLAAECNTAAVFHLMRASEVSLRAIAVDREVSFSDKPLDQKEWGQILGSLEGKLKDMRLDDAKNWSSPTFRESQIQFYNDTVQELRGFNEAWRRYLSHADPQAFYDHDSAEGISKHVRKFMQKLAAKIGENKKLPKYWVTE